jgi:uncharacterized membrane protein YuzA (DUF378 family)
MLDFITPQHMQILIIIACIGAINWAIAAAYPQYEVVSMILKDREQQKYAYYAIGLAGLLALVKMLQPMMM